MLRLLCKATFFFFFFLQQLNKHCADSYEIYIAFALLMKVGNQDQWLHSFPVQPIKASQIDWTKQPALIVSGFWMLQI